MNTYALLLLTLVFPACGDCSGREWPKIQDAEMSFRFESDFCEELMGFVYDKKGRPLYRLDVKFNAWKYDDPDYSFSGMLDCKLAPIDPDMGSDNFFKNEEDATRDWQSDGRFTCDDLMVAKGPDSSTSIFRKCKFRGMSVELEIRNIVLMEDSAIRGLDFKIVFVRDVTAVEAFSLHKDESRRKISGKRRRWK